jgi:ribonuclease R/exosome complex exonuclease DIS3/RRP44
MIKIGDKIEGNISSNSYGSAYLVDENIPKDIYIHKTNTNKALHNDRVKIEVVKGKGRALEGVVTEIVTRFRTKFVGTMEISKKFAFFRPDSRKMNVDIYVPLKKLKGAEHGQKVVVEMTDWKNKSKTPNGKVIEVLGYPGDNDTEIHAILHEHDLPYEFNQDVIDEANEISTEITDEDIYSRRDMRDILTYTIDPDTAKDFDDALSYDRLPNGNYQLGVHIADVSHYVRPDTELDKEAFQRGTSVYLVDRVVPMLPEHLSNGVCSLRPHEDKLCFSAVFELTPDGQVMDEWFGRTVIHSDHRFTYEEAQAVIDSEGSDDEGRMLVEDAGLTMDYKLAGLLTMATRDLNKTAKIMRAKRLGEGSITFNKQEVKFILDDNNKPVDILFKKTQDSNKLIEEYMLLANRKVAKFISDLKLPSVNRVHDEPNEDRLVELRELISQFGYKLNFNTIDELRKELNRLMIEVQGTTEANMIESLMVRTMQKAVYTTENLGHFGLAFKDYVHFTSPIRRYPDIMIHRLLNLYLNHRRDVNVSKLEGRCKHLSEMEKRAQKASRASIKYKQAEYMSERVGKIFKGVVISITDYGLFVSMPETGCEGLVRLTEIEGDTYKVEPGSYTATGTNFGAKVRLGDDVTVVIKNVDLLRKTVDLSLIRL